MDNSLFKALNGGQAAQVPQLSVPASPGSPGPEAGPIFKALMESGIHNQDAKPLEMGPMVADNSGLMKGNPFYRGEQPAQPQAQPQMKPINYTPPQAAHSPPPSDLSTTAANFFNKMKSR